MSIAFLSAGLKLFGQDTIMLKKKILGLTYSKKTYENIKFNSDWLINNIGKKSNITVHELYSGEPNGLVFKYKRKNSILQYKFKDTLQLFRKKYFKSKELKSYYFYNDKINGSFFGFYNKNQCKYWVKLRSDFSYRGYALDDKAIDLKLTHYNAKNGYKKIINNDYYYVVENFRTNAKGYHYYFECWPSLTVDSSLRHYAVRLYDGYFEDSLFLKYGIDTNLIIKHFEIQDTMFARLRRKVESEIIGKYGKPIISHLEVEKYLNWRFGIKKSEND